MQSESLGLQSGVLRDVFPLGEQRETELGVTDPRAVARFPFYFALPHDNPVELLKWRIYARNRCIKDLEFRKAVWEMCRRDAAFFAVTFLTLFEPRPRPRWLPFFLWQDQTNVLAWLEECYGRRSVAVNKTRGIGFSWLMTAFIFHKWMFDPESKIALITEDEDKLDSPDCNSTIGRLQYVFDHLPEWAKHTKSGMSKLKRTAEKHTFINIENAAVAQGFVSRAQKLRQMRFTAVFADEFAFYHKVDQEEWVVAAGGVTNNMILGSTWNDFESIFHHIMYEEESSLLKIHFFWWANKERWKGAYSVQDGVVTLVDKDYKHEPNYQFGQPDVMDEGMLRSPWVDAELSQPGKRKDILKALRDLYGMKVCSRTNSFFDNVLVQSAKLSITEPVKQGTLDTTRGEVGILPTLKSDIQLWEDLPEVDCGPYTAFCDLSQGVQAAFSVCQILDASGRHVLQYGTNELNITNFANSVIRICRWLCGRNGDNWVLLDFEMNAMSKPFVAEAERLQYRNIHFSEFKQHLTKKQKEKALRYAGTRNDDGGVASFQELQRAAVALETRIVSEKVYKDILRCDKNHDKNGQPKFPAGHRDGHGDFLHALAGAWWRARDSIQDEGMVQSSVKDYVPLNSWESQGNQRWSEFWN